MNDLPEWQFTNAHRHDQSSQFHNLLPTTPVTFVTKAVSTVALLAIGYYALTLFDAWPSTFWRSLHDTLIYITPSIVIYALQEIMVQLHYLDDSSPRLRREDFGNSQAKVEALAQIFGHTRIQTAVRKARTLSGFDNLISDIEKHTPPGLGNWDNSCYQNSVLQGFASLPLFKEYIERSAEVSDKAGVQAKTHHALAGFVESLNQITGRKTTLWTPPVLKAMDSWQQQDAQEYFSVVLDAIDKEAVRTNLVLKRRAEIGLESLLRDDRKLLIEKLANSTSGPQDVVNTHASILDGAASRNSIRISVTQNPLDGFLAQALECQTCGFSEGVSLTQFNCLTLNMGLRGTSRLEDLLDDYTEAEDIDGVECINCTKLANERNGQNEVPEITDEVVSNTDKQEKNRVLRTKAKQITVGRLPKDLVIHINRSIFDEFGNQRKNTAYISFPSTLGFGSHWCAPLGFDVDDPAPQAVYDLKCVVTHYGRHENGHYVALGKRGKQWYNFNDEIVMPVDEAEVLERGNVFMLFYEMRPLEAADKTLLCIDPTEDFSAIDAEDILAATLDKTLQITSGTQVSSSGEEVSNSLVQQPPVEA